jgi:glycosyltransferase involved in cell wall biosynthesis
MYNRVTTPLEKYVKIATIVRGYLPVPRPADIVYAPIDLAVSLSQGLQSRGHSVDFYAPEGSNLSVPVQSHGLRPLVKSQQEWEAFLQNTELQMHYVPHLWDYYLAKKMFEKARKGEYDVLHFHHPEIALFLAPQYPEVPVVYTLHDPLHGWYNEVFDMFKSPNQFFVSISNSQRAPRPSLNYAATVYNGVDLDTFLPPQKHNGHLLFAGRIVPEKGVKEAIEVAQKAGMPLLIAGPVFPDNRKYFNEHIKPHLGDTVKYLGYLNRDRLLTCYQDAKALLMPIQWEEPFGMNMIEAMACGTPVIALNRGSVPEVVKDGETGYIVNTIDEMVAAVHNLDKIDRSACRKHVEENFSIDHMVDNYEAVFEDVIAKLKKTQ